MTHLFTKQYLLSKKNDEEIESLVQDMKKQGIVRETTSPWNSPLLLLRKKNGVDCRLIADFLQFKINYGNRSNSSTEDLGIITKHGKCSVFFCTGS